MTTKLVKHSDKNATQISAYTVRGKRYIGIRTMYKSQKSGDKWMPGKGVSLAMDDDKALKILRKALKLVKDENTEFPEIKFED